MANEIDINIGSFDLDTSNNISIADIDIQVAKAISESGLPKFHGSIIPIGKRKSITVKIRGAVIGSNYDDLRTKLDNLKAACEQTSEKQLNLDDDRFLNVQYRGLSYGYKTLRTFADFSFDLIASDPFWYSKTLSSTTTSPTSGVAFQITNGGNAATRAKVTITAGGTAVSDDIRFENQDTGEVFQFRGSLGSTKDLVINNRVDQSDLSVLNDGEDDIVNFEGDFITLNPGVNDLVLTTGIAGLSVKVEHRDAYL